jgi:hypothetical protein
VAKSCDNGEPSSDARDDVDGVRVVVAHLFERQRGHRVDADVAAGDEGYCRPAARFLDCQQRAFALLRQRRRVDLLAFHVRPDPAQVQLICDDDIALPQRGNRARRDQVVETGTDRHQM